jgi:MFS family permease
MMIFNVPSVFVSTAVAGADQALGQGIFITVVQLAAAIGLSIASTVAHAGGAKEDASKLELWRGYRDCFWLCVGIIAVPLISVWFLRGNRASESAGAKEVQRQ